MIKSDTDRDATWQLKLEKEIHLRKSQIFYDDLKKYTKETKLNDELEVLAFDFQQNMLWC